MSQEEGLGIGKDLSRANWCLEAREAAVIELREDESLDELAMDRPERWLLEINATLFT